MGYTCEGLKRRPFFCFDSVCVVFASEGLQRRPFFCRRGNHGSHLFQSPPTFRGNPDEDALEWLERYETVDRYNRWRSEDLRLNFIVSLDGAALNRFRCVGTVPTTWEDVPAQLPARSGGSGVGEKIGLRSLFLREFQQHKVHSPHIL